MIENYRKLMYYAIMTVVLFSCVQQTVASDSSTEGILVNYTAKRYLFEQSTVREFFSGAYYDLFLVMRGSGVFRCSKVVLPAQQQNLIILKPGQGGRLEYAGAFSISSLISCMFENDVKMYGTQTRSDKKEPGGKFENDVKMYGTQTFLNIGIGC